MQETWVWSLSWEDPLEEKMATHYSILAWKIPWTEELGGLQSTGSQRVRHDWAWMQKKKSLRMLGHISFYLVCIHIQKITKLAFHWSSHQNAMRDCRPFVRPAPRMGDNFSETGSSDWKVKFHSDGKPRWFKFQAVSLPLPSPWEEYTRTTYWLRENEEYVKQNHPLETQRHSCVDVRTGPWKRLSSGELMLSNCGIGDDF